MFEELPACSQAEWAKMGTKIKSMATEKELTFSDKYEKAVTAKNLMNIVINTNENALKDTEGRRVYELPFSTKRKSDHEYFGSMEDECLNNAVGDSYLMTKISDETARKL